MQITLVVFKYPIFLLQIIYSNSRTEKNIHWEIFFCTFSSEKQQKLVFRWQVMDKLIVLLKSRCFAESYRTRTLNNKHKQNREKVKHIFTTSCNKHEISDRAGFHGKCTHYHSKAHSPAGCGLAACSEFDCITYQQRKHPPTLLTGKFPSWWGRHASSGRRWLVFHN